MGSCASKPKQSSGRQLDSSSASRTKTPVARQQKTTTTSPQLDVSTKSKAKFKGEGRTIGSSSASNNNNNNNNTLGSSDSEIIQLNDLDPGKRAALAAQNRLENQKSKQGKLGNKLAMERAKSNKTVIDETSAENTKARNETPLVYD